MFGYGIGNAQKQDGFADAVFRQYFQHCAACAALFGVFFGGNDVIVALGEADDEFLVYRFDEAHIGDGGVQFFGNRQCGGDHAAKGDEGGFLAFAADNALADFHGFHTV